MTPKTDPKTTCLSIFTIGHSTRPIEKFLDILKHYHINKLIDIRSIPKSGHNPQYNAKELESMLTENGIGYVHQKNLGGRRPASTFSLNLAWKNNSFRGFADYMQTKEFEEGIKTLIKFAQKNRVAMMCSEALPWRCHRSLIGDALLARGIEVQDIYSKTSTKPHTMTPWAWADKTIIYPSKIEREALKTIKNKTTEQYTNIKYRVTYDTKLLFIGANPSPGTYERGIPYSNNKTLWYLLYESGLIHENRDILHDDKKLKKLYDQKFAQVYHLGLLNIANRPSKTFTEIKQVEAIPGALRIMAAIKKYQPMVVCFIGKRTYQLFAQKKQFHYGWQARINSSRVYVMHTPLHGLARIRINELKTVGIAAGLL